jgi:hypothetical protein
MLAKALDRDLAGREFASPQKWRQGRRPSQFDRKSRDDGMGLSGNIVDYQLGYCSLKLNRRFVAGLNLD